MLPPVPCVTAALVNRMGQILLQQRDNRATIRYPGWWSTLGGRVETGEHPDAAIRRELWEEIARVPALRRWKVYSRPGPKPLIVRQYVYVGALDEPIASIPLREGQALAYVDASGLADLPIAFGFAALCQEWFACYAATGSVEECIDALTASAPEGCDGW
ncbi:MAG TPA: NUDIX domain-containing protein [Roseiflexaceae bacterium]|nr:NUDIX domain-containing protein [Roseiflexaceae bacterium]